METVLELAAIKIENSQSTVYVPGRFYTFSQIAGIPAEKEKALLEFLTYCREFDLVKNPWPYFWGRGSIDAFAVL